MSQPSPIQIPASELEFTYVRSSGPGGQNVNKVNSKAVLRWNIHESQAFGPVVRARLLRVLENQITGEGEILISSDRYRDQLRNREDCVEKLHMMVRAAALPPVIRKKTKPTFSSQRKGKEAKSLHSKKKNMRKAGRDYD